MVFHIVITRYLRPFPEMDAAMQDHQAYLDACYRRGVFVLSGPRHPRDGGIILARTDTREDLLEILQEDPFSARGLIEYDVIGWDLNRRASALPEALFPGSRTALPLQ
ncbi:YciI family protein [Paraburkholderia sabiae]|uniref:YciI family protein n=1 Tax=Paraburkholderia sabiae TaxID=273251 RepID=A0ABU9QIE6_9BURK|nr:YciI family protein [Paraburkholderia sabiae]WJZ77436.1 YciI family protein [Paraburkholderia sabiae]CAD6557816.1 hypothetical protein LMG24235_06223 [Paraburkholderia sabiae]